MRPFNKNRQDANMAGNAAKTSSLEVIKTWVTRNFLPLAGSTVSGNLTVQGNTQLGDAATDTIGFYDQTATARQNHLVNLKVDYTTGDLDTESKVITAINATNTRVNNILTALETIGILKTS